MAGQATQWWITLEGGKRFAVTAGGLVFGRAAHCDVVLTDPGASPGADLRVDGWPAEVMRLVIVDRLHVHALEPLVVDGRGLDPGGLEVLGERHPTCPR